MTSFDYDVIVIGAGPGGSTLATLLAKKGHSVGLFEKEEFPVFKIGESLLPHSMDILKESGVFEKINSGKYIRKYGASFIDYREDQPIYFEFINGLDREHEYAFEVPREEFDKDLLDHAKSCGVQVHQPCRVKKIEWGEESIYVDTEDGIKACRFIVDASGRKAFLGQQLQNRSKNQNFINNIAIFNHYRNVKRTVQEKDGDIIIGILPDSSWSWHIPFKGDITSVGVVCSPEAFKKVSNEKDIVCKLLSCHPKFNEIMAGSEVLREQQIVSNYSYSSEQKISDRWIMIGDAATFLDPVFSSGVHISLQSALLASKALDEALSNSKTLMETPTGQSYEKELKKGVDRFQSLLLIFYKTAFYKHMSKTIQTDMLYKSFTSAISGDMWNENNFLFRLGILKDGKLPNENYSV